MEEQPVASRGDLGPGWLMQYNVGRRTRIRFNPDLTYVRDLRSENVRKY